MARETLGGVFTVTILLGVICSLLISAAVVGLRDLQTANAIQDKKKNILIAAGLYHEGVPIDASFGAIESRIINLETGEYASSEEIDPNTYDQRAAPRDPDLSVAIDPELDIAGLGRRESYSFAYLVQKDGQLEQIILPIYGKGLWGTMYAFVALGPDLETVRGLTFYEHIETPGLGAEVDNPVWQEGWVGKKLYREDGSVGLRVIKGTVDANSANANYEVDGISGATLTTNGVTSSIAYWFGDHGFKNFLKRLRERGTTDG